MPLRLKAWVKQTVLDLIDRHGCFLMWESEFHAFVPQPISHSLFLRSVNFFSVLFLFHLLLFQLSPVS